MAAAGDGVAAYLSTAATFTPITSAYSWAFWYFPTDAPVSGGGAMHPFSFVDATEAYDVNFAWDHPDAAFYKAAIHRNADTTYVKAQHPGTPASGAWYHVAGTFDGSTLRLYYDGVQVASAAATAPTNSVSPKLSALCYKDGTSGFDDSIVAEMAVWSRCLSAAEVMSLRTGTAPSSLSTNLVSYSKLNTADITTTGNALTNNGATLNTSFFIGDSGGLVLGGSSTITADYVVTNSGGLVLGGSTPSTFETWFSTSQTMASTSDDIDTMTTAMDQASDITPVKYNANLSTEMRQRSRFYPSGIALVRGRCSGRTRR